MNIRVLLSLVYVFATLGLFGQWTELDTLKPSSSFLSTEDSVLRFIQPSQSIVPSVAATEGGLLNPLSVYQPMGTLLHPKALRENSLQFSALPFLGFAYAFGTQGSQHMKFNYAQAFRHGLVFNVDYLAHGSNGFIRNNSWSNRDYMFKFAKVTGRYQAQINAHGMHDYRQFSGGLLIDSLANDFSLNLLPVRKDSCASTWKMKQIQVKQAINFLKDSSQFFGLYDNASLRASERNYMEYDSLYALYPAWYIDSNSTNDRYEWVSLRHEGGLGLKFNRIKAQLGGVVEYWRMRMMGSQRDTLELGLNGVLNFQGSNWKAKLSAEQNISGAFKAFDYNGHLLVSLGHNHTLNVKGGYAALAPDVFQRTYLGNTLQYQLLNPQLQQVVSASLLLDGKVFGLDYSLKISGLNTKGVYQFTGLIWQNQSNISSQQLLVGSGSINKLWKGLRIGVLAQVLLQQNAVFPASTVGVNLGYSGYITKSKSLYFFSSVNYRYISGYKPLSILPQLSLISLSTQGNSVYDLHSLTMLIGFKVKTFRFFFSGANIGTLWMPKDQPLYDHLPIPSFQLQVGISWEFWN